MINTTVYKNKEQQLRRALRKEGYSLHKSRKAVSIDNLGGYMIVNSYRNVVVAGSRYELSLDDVAEWLEG
jgi:hypothetical protein